MPACTIAPADRRRQICLVGKDLLKRHGKRNFYAVQEVKNANRRQGISYDFACWSHAFFNSHEDFDAYHQRLGESCDYVAMKKEMAESLAGVDVSGVMT